MTKQNQAEFAALRMREPTAPSLGRQAAIASSAAVQARVAQSFEETAAAENTFHVWRNQHLVPAHNRSIDFTNEVRVPAGKRAVIEVVTATISIPNGEDVRLRMYTSLGPAAYDIDLCLALQGQMRGRQILVATECRQVYSDYLIEFNVGRDNAQTEGDAFIGVSGYFTDAWHDRLTP
jgi:hypothetical protein